MPAGADILGNTSPSFSTYPSLLLPIMGGSLMPFIVEVCTIALPATRLNTAAWRVAEEDKGTEEALPTCRQQA